MRDQYRTRFSPHFRCAISAALPIVSLRRRKHGCCCRPGRRCAHDGLANKQISQELHVSQATVRTHVINHYGKIGVNTRAGATVFAFEHDLTDPANM
jgi:hypothetical protein